MNESDHDLLIRIDTNLVAFNKVFLEHTNQDAKEFGKIDLKITSAHKRIDSLIRVRDMVSGAIALVGFLSLILGIVFTAHRMNLW